MNEADSIFLILTLTHILCIVIGYGCGRDRDEANYPRLNLRKPTRKEWR